MLSKLFLSIVLFSLLFNCNAQVNLSSGLVAYFPFNGNTLDASGNGNNAINYGASLTTDQWGNSNSAYIFNGTSNYMSVSNSPSLQSSSWTFCARVKPNSFYQGLCYNNSILDRGNGGYNAGSFSLIYTPTLNQNPTTYCFIPDSTHENYRINVNNSANPSLACITPINGIPYIDTNGWDCVIGIFNDTTLTGSIFVNGVFRYSYTLPSLSGGINNNPLLIGGTTNPTYPYFVNGKLDEIRIYNRALNLQEIDSVCNLVESVDTIINHYAAVNSYSPCNNSIEVDTATDFLVGDTVLFIQMKGSEIDSSNSTNFGNILTYNNCGNYEINVIQNISGNTISFLNVLTRQYDIPNGKVQIVSVPTFTNYVINTPHTCLPWNGVKGGVFIINVLGNLNLNSEINTSGKGFQGGVSNIVNSGIMNCNQMQFFDSPNIDNSAAKGEGITNISLSKSYARGKLANGGGGGNGHNAGGGGGGNANFGGIGGSQFFTCNNNPLPNNTGGIGGLQLDYNTLSNKIFLGGGGGAGQSNNYSSSFPAINLHTSDGAPGGGIVIVRANNLVSSGGILISNGNNGYSCTNTGAYGVCHDGMGGGGAGGTILLSTNSIIGNLDVICKGGKGGDVSSSGSLNQLGPGGGGSGGIFWFSGATISSLINVNSTFGNNGVCLNSLNDSWGAQNGQSGSSISNLLIPIDSIPFNSILNFANAGIDTMICQGSSTTLQASGGISYLWSPSTSLSNASISNPIATPNATTTYSVVVTDVNGCTDLDLVTISVLPSPILSTSANPSTVCTGDATILTASGATSYIWTGGVSNGISFIPLSTTTYTVIGTDGNTCTNTSSVTVTVSNPITITISPSDPVLCLGDSVQLNALGASTYNWSPNANITNSSISNPFVFPSTTTTYFVTGTDATGCTGTASVDIEIVIDPQLKLSKSGDIECNMHTILLSASGASSYAWEPSALVSSPNAAITNANVNMPTTFICTGIIGSCILVDSIYVDAFNNEESSFFIPNAFSPNDDGKNDCLSILNNAKFTDYYFTIFNRWGQKVFESDKPNACWDGTFQSKPCPLATYYYFLQAETKCGKVFRKGDINLIR